MPTDLDPQKDLPIILVRDREGVGLPFSKGLMATSILATGIETELAYNVAIAIQNRLIAENHTEITSQDLTDLAGEVLTELRGTEVARRYRAWQRVKRTGRPLIIALAGAPGIGKSTIATRLAVRFGITRVVTTDTIREILRTVIPRTVLPELHVSTYENVDDPLIGERPRKAFQRQARAVVAGAVAVAQRIVSERQNAIVEGIHMLPGELRDSLRDHASQPIVVEVLLTLNDKERHRSQLTYRMYGEPARGGDRHLQHFEAIRELQAQLQNAAKINEVKAFDVESRFDLTQWIIDDIVHLAGEQDA